MRLEDKIRKVTPYTPGEQPKVCGDLIKLNTNENPYPPSPKVREAMESLPLGDMRLYPNVTAAPLAKALAEYHGLREEQIFVGVGSDDVLANCFLTFFASDEPVLFPDITYSFYDVWAKLYHIPYREIPLDENFRINPADYKAPNGGVIFANPNAPTGIYASLDVVEEILKNNTESIVIVDEAYIDYGGESALPLLNRYENLVVVRTFSKSRAFAGMRIGYACASPKLIAYLNDVKFSINSYTMNCTSINYGIASIADDAYFRERVEQVVATRERTVEELKKLGFLVLPSSANFVFASHERVSAEEIFNYLKSKNIYVRFFKKPRIDNFLRITIGTDEQMERLFAELADFLNS